MDKKIKVVVPRTALLYFCFLYVAEENFQNGKKNELVECLISKDPKMDALHLR